MRSKTYATSVTVMKLSIFNMDGDDGGGGAAVAHNTGKFTHLYLNIMMLSAAHNLQHKIMNED